MGAGGEKTDFPSVVPKLRGIVLFSGAHFIAWGIVLSCNRERLLLAVSSLCANWAKSVHGLSILEGTENESINKKKSAAVRSGLSKCS